jgi:hypothetical protein
VKGTTSQSLDARASRLCIGQWGTALLHSATLEDTNSHVGLKTRVVGAKHFPGRLAGRARGWYYTGDEATNSFNSNQSDTKIA